MNDLSMMVDEGIKLNVRTTGIFTKDGKVLVHYSEKDGHYALPGGRVKAGEDSMQALQREVREEIGAEIKNIFSMGVMENFFKNAKCNYHEYMWMIKAEFEDKSFYENEKVYGYEDDDGEKLIFDWIDIDKLEQVDFRPNAAIPYIKNLDGKVHHVINHTEK